MSYRPLTAVLPRVILFVGILLAVSMLAIPLYNSAFAQEDGPIPYAENGTGPVATYTAADPEGTAIIWSVTGDDAEDFDINEGVLTFKQSPNYEDPADTGHRQRIRDNGGGHRQRRTNADMIGRNRDGDQRGRGGHADAVHATAGGWH